MAGRGSLAERAGSRADLWLALLSGPGPWLDPDARPTTVDLVAILGQALGLATVVTLSAVDVIDHGWTNADLLPTAALAVAYIVLVVVLAGPTLGWAWRGRLVEPLAQRPRAAALLRSFVVVGALSAWMLHGPRAPALSAWPFGIAGGCEVALTIWAIGIKARPALWWRRFLASAPHFGSLVTLVGLLIAAGSGDSWKALVALYAALHIVVAVLALTIAALERVRRAVGVDLVRREKEVLADEHRRRAHWLHDEVCTRLGFVQKRIEGGQIESEEIAAELGRLDHSLRERQLEELMGAGAVGLAEVIQPYLRMAQQQGVLLTDVPGYEVAQRKLTGDVGRMAQRVLSNVVGNAIKAGATELAIRVDMSPSVMTLEIEDDAGGFDHSKLTPGRGLDRLRHELGEGCLTFVSSEMGTTVRADIRLEADDGTDGVSRLESRSPVG